MIFDPVQAVAEFPEVWKTHSPPTVPTSSKPSPTATVVPEPSVEWQYAHESGKRALWVVFVIMLVASIAFTVMAWSVPVTKRLYHVVTTLIVLTAATSYFAMAVGDGISWHPIVLKEAQEHVPDTVHIVVRQVYWARYVDWAITTPLLLLDLTLLAGLSGANIIIAIAADLFMVIVGLFAAFGKESTPQKWGYYAIACVAYLVIVWHLVIHGRASAYSKGGKVGGFYIAIASFTLLLWTAYPIVWGVADGARIASVDAEIIAYAILDVLAKPIFGLWLLLTHSNVPETNVDIGGFWAHGVSSEGAIRIDDDEGA